MVTFPSCLRGSNPGPLNLATKSDMSCIRTLLHCCGQHLFCWATLGGDMLWSSPILYGMESPVPCSFVCCTCLCLQLLGATSHVCLILPQPVLALWSEFYWTLAQPPASCQAWSGTPQRAWNEGVACAHAHQLSYLDGITAHCNFGTKHHLLGLRVQSQSQS